MKKCLIMICGIQRPAYKDCYMSWFENLIACNHDIYFDTIISFDSTRDNEKWFWLEIESWETTQKNIKKLFTDERWGKVKLVDHQPIGMLKSLSNLGIKFYPEIGPWRPVKRIVDIQNNHQSLDEYDYCFYIRPDATMKKRIILSESMGLNIITNQTGGGYFLDRDWDYCWCGETEAFKYWINNLEKLSDGSTDIIKYIKRDDRSMLLDRKFFMENKKDKHKRYYIDNEPNIGVYLIENFIFDTILRSSYKLEIIEGLNDLCSSLPTEET